MLAERAAPADREIRVPHRSPPGEPAELGAQTQAARRVVLETVDDERRPAAQLGVKTALVEAPARGAELDDEIGVALLADGPGVEQLEDGCRRARCWCSTRVELAPWKRLAQRALGEQRLPLEVALLEFGGREAEGDHPGRIGMRQIGGFCQPPDLLSRNDATAMQMSSRQGLATTCKPIGNLPSAELPQRTTTTGQPVLLKAPV